MSTLIQEQKEDGIDWKNPLPLLNLWNEVINKTSKKVSNMLLSKEEVFEKINKV